MQGMQLGVIVNQRGEPKSSAHYFLKFLNLNKPIEDYLLFQRKRTQNIM